MRFLLLSMFGWALWAQTPASAPKPPSPKPAAAKPAATKPVPAKPSGASSAAAKADPNNPVVLTVGTEKITKNEFDSFVSNLPEQLRTETATPAGKRRIAERLAEVKSLAQEARKRHLEARPAVRQQLALQEESVLANALYQDLMEGARPLEAEARKYYEANKGEYEQAKARHILIRFKGSRVPLKKDQKDLTDEEALAKAQQVRDRLMKGEDFATVAKAESDDTGSGANGGDLGQFGRGRMVGSFDQAAFSLPINQVSEPVKSPFGYHIIQVQERSTTPFEQVRAGIEKKQQQDAAAKALESIKDAAKISLDETYFGKPESAPAPPPAAAQK